MSQTVTLLGCEPYKGRLGLVTRDDVDSAVLLKSGYPYQEVGIKSASVCQRGNEETPENFAKAIEKALSQASDGAHALIEVTTVTHRGNYFPIWGVIPLPFVPPLPFGFPGPDFCTTVSGMAIKFIQPPDCAPCIVAPTGTWLRQVSRGDVNEVPIVKSLFPILEWEPFLGQNENVTYDLLVRRAKTGWSWVKEGPIVYERHGLTQSSHRIEMFLKPSTHYLWAIRAHFTRHGETQVTRWSYEMLGKSDDKPQYYHFLTPPP